MSPVGDSSPDLSSPPSGSSPPHHNLQPNEFPNERIHVLPTSVAENTDAKDAKKSIPKDPSAPKRLRKKKDPNDQAAGNNSIATSNVLDPKPKKPRVPRGTGPQALKKKAEMEAKKAAENAALLHASQPMQDGFARPTPPPAISGLPISLPQNGNHEAIPSSQPYIPNPNTLLRPSSGQNYDPIRSSTIAPRPPSPTTTNTTPSKSAPIVNATRSPSISSLIDPPNTIRPYATDVPTSTHDSKRLRLSPPPLQPYTIAAKSPSSHAAINSPPPQGNSYNHVDAPRPSDDISGPAPAKQSASTKKPIASKGTSPGSRSPKPTSRKETASIASTGSGLLSGSVFGGDGSGSLEDAGPTKSAPTVVINVPLTGDNQYINFTRLAEEKYGFNALHPRLAAQRDRLARVAAAGAALENAYKNGSGVSADEMSVDLSNDEGDNSNVEMGGLDAEQNGLLGTKSGEDTGEAPKRRKRIMKEDMYDKDDDFIDDTEQAWEEQAAVSKDGFFVYSGPLVPEGEEVKVERSSSAPKRGGRGSGRGGRGGGSRAKANATVASGKETKDGKPIKRVRRSKEQIERDNLQEAQKKAQKESFALLASKPPAPPIHVLNQVAGMQMTT